MHTVGPKLLSVGTAFALVIVAVIGFSVISVPVAAHISWTSTTSYPTPILLQNCVVSGGYVYCVGGVTPAGYTRAVYFASLSSSGVGTWTSSTSYPKPITYQSCVANAGYIYCVGGYDGNEVTDAVYSAALSSSGVGAWKRTASYPTTITFQSCVVSGGYVYCVGGDRFGNGTVVNGAYFASLSSSGLGWWKKTTAYPTHIQAQSCDVSGGYIYCVGGLTTSSSTTSAVYFASLSSSGIGAWASSTTYSSNIGFQSCVVNVGSIYCVGGFAGHIGQSVTKALGFASLSSSGVGSWTSITSYPTPITWQSCVVSGGYMYCVGGFTGSTSTSAVNFALI